ncbi:MAG TPA: hypothetical protein VF283_14810 [Bryobacteraceae bacterium]
MRSIATLVTRFLVIFLIVGAIYCQASLTLAQREALARPLLLHAEAIAASYDPATRAFILYRAAGAWIDLDRPHAIELYRQSFDSALLITSRSLRKAAEHDILEELLPLSPRSMLNLLKRAEPETQKLLYKAAINFSLMQGNRLPEAIQAFDQASAAGVFSESTTTSLLLALPKADEAGRVHIFNTAFAVYRSKRSDQSVVWTASRLVARFWQDLPANDVLRAIDIVLARASEKYKQEPLGAASIGYGKNSLSYRTYTDIELFAVFPALSRLDPTRAAALLAAHPAVAGYLHRFPNGLPSFDIAGFYPGSGRVGVSPPQQLPLGTATYATEKGAHSMSLSPLDMGLEFTISLNLAERLGVTGSAIPAQPGSPEAALLGTGNTCPADVAHILASADTVPVSRRVPFICSGLYGNSCSYMEEFPRANIFNALAERCTYYPGKPSAMAALSAEVKLLAQIPADQRPNYLANAADLYLRLGERNLAASVVQTGFEIARDMFATESKSMIYRSFPKAVWPAAETYRRMISLGVNANFEKTVSAVEAIPDPELRELERLMLARSLLGIPVRQYLIVNASGHLSGVDEIDYEGF